MTTVRVYAVWPFNFIPCAFSFMNDSILCLLLMQRRAIFFTRSFVYIQRHGDTESSSEVLSACCSPTITEFVLFDCHSLTPSPTPPLACPRPFAARVAWPGIAREARQPPLAAAQACATSCAAPRRRGLLVVRALLLLVRPRPALALLIQPMLGVTAHHGDVRGSGIHLETGKAEECVVIKSMYEEVHAQLHVRHQYALDATTIAWKQEG